MSFYVHPNILTALRMLFEKGYSAYIVGGTVRDRILDIPSSDYDIATSATLDEAAEVFSEYKVKKYISKGITLGVVLNHTHFELSTFKGINIQEDLRMRDFTMNSMAWGVEDNVLDPYNGIYDMSVHVLRTVRDPDEVLREDPIRILRAIRFYATHGMKPDEALSMSMHKNRDLLNDVKKERIHKELDAILLSDNPSIYLREYADVFAVIFPELGRCIGFDQHNTYWHNLDVYEHTLKVVDSTKNILTLRLAALLHDVKKPECFTMDDKGIGHFYGHPEKSAEYADEILTELCYGHETTNRVTHLIYFHDYDLVPDEKRVLKFLYKFGTNDLDLYFGLRRADILGQNPALYDRLYAMDDAAALAKKLIDEERIITYKNLAIKGNDLLALGFEGVEIGRALEHILTKVVRHELKNNHEKLYNYAAELKYHRDELFVHQE